MVYKQVLWQIIDRTRVSTAFMSIGGVLVSTLMDINEPLYFPCHAHILWHFTVSYIYIHGFSVLL